MEQKRQRIVLLETCQFSLDEPRAWIRVFLSGRLTENFPILCQGWTLTLIQASEAYYYASRSGKRFEIPKDLAAPYPFLTALRDEISSILEVYSFYLICSLVLLGATFFSWHEGDWSGVFWAGGFLLSLGHLIGILLSELIELFRLYRKGD